jgi:hypothetical protein
MIYRFNSKTLLYDKVRIWPYLLIVSSTLLFTSSITIKHIIVEKVPIVINNKNIILTKENIDAQLTKLNIKHKEIVLRQILLETNYLRSQSCLIGNNLIGMKPAFQRNRYQSGEYLGHASYDTWQESLIDYALFQSTYCTNIKTTDEYYNFLAEFYAEDPNYINKLKNIKL